MSHTPIHHNIINTFSYSLVGDIRQIGVGVRRCRPRRRCTLDHGRLSEFVCLVMEWGRPPMTLHCNRSDLPPYPPHSLGYGSPDACRRPVRSPRARGSVLSARYELIVEGERRPSYPAIHSFPVADRSSVGTLSAPFRRLLLSCGSSAPVIVWARFPERREG